MDTIPIRVDPQAAGLSEDISFITKTIDCLVRSYDIENNSVDESTIKVAWRSRYRLEIVQKVLEAIKEQLLDGTTGEDSYCTLESSIQSCKNKIVALDALTRRGIPITNASMLGHFFGRIRGLPLEEQIDVLVDGILDDVSNHRSDNTHDEGQRVSRSRESLQLTQRAYHASFTNFALLRERQTDPDVGLAEQPFRHGVLTMFTRYATLREGGLDSDEIENLFLEHRRLPFCSPPTAFQNVSLRPQDPLPLAALFPKPRGQSLNQFKPKSHVETVSSGLAAYVNTSLVPFLPYVEKLSDKEEDYHINHTSIANAGWIELDTIRNWIGSCDRYHGDHCAPSKTECHHALRPLWFIDVVRSCLVSSQKCNRYVALSYVWSRSEALSTTLSNVESLQKLEALLDQTVVLPRTVEDAIGLTRLLGEKYLWVDRLCIVQDDEEAKSQQLDSMGEVYANSYFTIVAAQGKDADDGLRGIPDLTPQRQLGIRRLQKSIDCDNKYEALSIQAMRLMRTTWYSRGWTFQEHLFSRRILVFQNDTVNWECHCAALCEHQRSLNNSHPAMPQCQRKTRSYPLDINDRNWPDFHHYARLVSLYNRRCLTFPEDILKAFAGLTTALGPWFDGGFICGLPQMFFHAALLWQPYRVLKRRQGIRTTKNIPSWSWIGWQGDLHSESWRSGYDYTKECSKVRGEEHGQLLDIWERPSWRTNCTIDWYYSENLDSQRYPITATSQIYRGSDDEAVSDLPEEWSKHVGDDYNYYKHPSDPKQDFWYPIPLPGSYSASLPAVQPTYLHARTRSCNLRFGEPFVNPQTSECLSYDIVDVKGDWVGALRLNLHASAKSVDKRCGSECLLVELSSGSVRDQAIEAVSFDEWLRPDCPRYHSLYEFYNVLQVQIVEGVAYRMALGRVVKRVWDELAEEMDISLG